MVKILHPFGECGQYMLPVTVKVTLAPVSTESDFGVVVPLASEFADFAGHFPLLQFLLTRPGLDVIGTGEG